MRWPSKSGGLNVGIAWTLCAVAILFSGCGDGGIQEKLDAAQRSVQTALDAWKRGESAESLKTGPAAIEFFDDDWNRSARLVEFEIRQTYMDTDGTPRCAVALVVQVGEQSPKRIQVGYQVVTKEKNTAIARDPFS